MRLKIVLRRLNLINEKQIYDLDRLIPGIFECNQPDIVLDKLIEHIEILESHIERIKNTHSQLYGGKFKDEKFLATEILNAQKFLDARNAKRKQ